jgi:hypothetical protein
MVVDMTGAIGVDQEALLQIQLRMESLARAFGTMPSLSDIDVSATGDGALAEDLNGFAALWRSSRTQVLAELEDAAAIVGNAARQYEQVDRAIASDESTTRETAD